MAQELQYFSKDGLGIAKSVTSGVSIFFGASANASDIFNEVEAAGGALLGSLYIGTSGIIFQKTSNDGDSGDWTDGAVAAPINTADLVNSAVTTAKINDAAVTTAKINDAAVTTAKINDQAVTAAKLAVVPFVRTAQLTAAAAGTPVEVLANADVGNGRSAVVFDMILNVGGGTAWTDATATVVKLQDKAGSPVALATVAKAQLTGNAVLGILSTGVTLAAPIKEGTGTTDGKGIDIVGDANFAAGSTINVTVIGFITAV